MSIDHLYESIGGMGRFQVITVILVSSCLFTIGWSMLQMTFAGAIPDFSCGFNNADDTFGNSTIGHFSNETMNVCSVNGTKCDVFAYKTSSKTAITEWDIVCELKWTKKVIISVQMVGVLLGAGIAGQLGDLFGRRKVLYSFAAFHIVLNVITAFAASWIIFASCRLLIGICIGAVVLVVLPYQLEFLPLKWRPLIGIVPSWSLGVALFASAALLLDNWSHLHIACGVISIPSILGCLFVPESPRWLAVHGRIDEAEKIINRVARINKAEPPSNIRSVLQKVRQEQLGLEAKSQKYTYIDLFRNCQSATVSAVLFFIWFTMAVVYYGISFGVASLTGNLYLNIFLLGIMEIPVQTTTFCFNNKIGRHKTTFMFFLFCFIPVLGCLFFYLFTTSTTQGIGINVFSQFAKMMIGSAWSSVQVWGTESFPTATRNLGCGFQSMGARIGGILAPLVINLDDRMGESYAILSILLFVTMALTFAIPDTKGKILPDNLQWKEIDIEDCHSNGNPLVVELNEDKKIQNGDL